MEAEVVANSPSSVDSHQPADLQNGMVDEILRPDKGSMNLLVQTDTSNMGRIRTYSTCNMDDVLQLDVEGSTLNSMMLNEEVMEQSMDSWTAEINSIVELSTIDIGDNKKVQTHVGVLPSYSMSKPRSQTLEHLAEENTSGLNPSSPSLNMLNSSITHTLTHKGRTKIREEPEFNVLHLDDHAITDLETFPLFSMDDDVGSLLEQFEEVSQTGSINTDIDLTIIDRKQQDVYDFSTDSIPLPVHRVSSDSGLCELVSARDHSNNRRAGNIKEESPEVVRLLKAKPALTKLSKATSQTTGGDTNMPNAEVLRKIRSNNKRKSTILLSDALPNRGDRSCRSNKHLSLPVYASKKLRKLLGHTMEDSDQSEREETRLAGEDSSRSSTDVSVLASLQDGVTKAMDICTYPATPETITAPSTPAPPSGGNSGCSTPDVPKRKITLSAYKSRLSNMQKGSCSGSNTPVDSGRSTPVKEFEDNTQIIINTVKAKLTEQLGVSKPHGEKAKNVCNSDYYSIVMDHDYCQVAKLYKQEVKSTKVAADTWGVNPHGSQKNKLPKTMSRSLSLPVMPVQMSEQSHENSRHYSKGFTRPKVKLPDLLAHPPLHPIKAKEKPSSPVKQTPAVEILKSEICNSVEPAEEPVVDNELEQDTDEKQSSMLKDLLLSPELEKEMQEQAKVDREESMRRMSSRSSLSPDIEDVAFGDEQFQESTEVWDMDLTETTNQSEDEITAVIERVEEIDRFSKFEAEKENTLLLATIAEVADVKKPNSKHNKRRYRKKDRSKSPENLKEPYFDKLPNYCTALAHKNELEIHKSFKDIKRLANSGLPTRDRDPSPDRDAALFNKVPAYFQCFTNSTRYDNMPERESPVLEEDAYQWVEKIQQKSNNSSRATSPGLIINTGPTSRANSRSRPSSRTSAQIRAESKSPTTVTSRSSVSDLNTRRGSQRNRKRSYSSSSRSRSRSHSRSRSRSRSDSCSRSSSRGRSLRSRSPGYRRQNKRRKYSRSRSRSSSWDRWKTEQRKRREEEKRSKMKQRKIMYVGGIPESFTKSDLRKSFDKFGKIEDVSLHFREHGDNYGFVTFTYRCDAFAAIEMGKSVPGCKNFDLCFGGRRLFCKTRYEDLDGNMEDEEEMAPVLSQSAETLDFDKLLRQALKKKL